MSRPIRSSLFILLSSLLFASAGFAEGKKKDEPPKQWPLTMQMKPHPTLNVDGLDFSIETRGQLRFRSEAYLYTDSETPSALVTSHRARLGLTVKALKHAKWVVDVQDVRRWGAEQPLPGKPPDPTLFGFSAPALDFHQAYAALTYSGVELRVGRQEIALDSQRIMGAVNYSQQGRSFDGVRALYKIANVKLTAFGAIPRDGGVSTEDNPVPTVLLGGLHAAWTPLDKVLTVAPLLLVDSHSALERVRLTTGARLNGGVAGLKYDLEGYYQGAQVATETTSAFMLAGRVSYGLDMTLKPRAELFTDVLSGTVGPFTAFDTLYATNHKWYGLRDIFLNLPKHTKGAGLVDAGGKVSVKADQFYGWAALHLFTAAAPIDGGPMYGVEPDLVVGYKPMKHVAFEFVTSAFIPLSDALGVPFSPWSYLQLNLQF